MTEGYIGVSNDPNRRLIEHQRRIQNPHLSNAFKKYKNIAHNILLEGDEAYCYAIEERLRPTTNIGWNINSGGVMPPNCTGMRHTTNTIEQIRKMANRPQRIEQQRNILRKVLSECHPMHDPVILEKHRIRCSKKWIVTNPYGEVFNITNLRQYCRDNDLNHGNMQSVAKGRKTHNKGWKCTYA